MNFEWESQAILPDAKVARVFSPSNIALAKYWGKRDSLLNLPTNGSISATLDDYGSYTTVSFHSSYEVDRLILNGQEQRGGKLNKVLLVLDEIRKKAGVSYRALIQSKNNFPTGAGLASSASGLSAVTLAAAHALNIDSDLKWLSSVARRGSGSACRSLWGGYVAWDRGVNPDGTDSVGRQIASEAHFPMDVFLLLVNQAEKAYPSTEAMEHTRCTSPYFNAWVQAAEESLAAIELAIMEKNFSTLASLAESNCIRFHCSAMAALPPVIYLLGQTVDLMHHITRLRQEGLRVFYTIDAGPNVVVFCDPSHSNQVLSEMKTHGNIKILKTKVGRGARIIYA